MRGNKTLCICLCVAAGFVLLGVVYRPIRVCCFLCAAAAAVVAAFSALLHRREKRWARIACCALALLLSSGLTVFSMLETRILLYAHTDSERSVSAVVILGAGVDGTRPSLTLERRLNAALDYLADKPDIPIVVSGGQGAGEAVSEARCMCDWLVARGVASERILLDEASFCTRENVENSKALLREYGVDITDNIAVVTSDYHLYRARLYWGGSWMVPVAADMPGIYWVLEANYYLREGFAVAKMLVLGG